MKSVFIKSIALSSGREEGSMGGSTMLPNKRRQVKKTSEFEEKIYLYRPHQEVE